MADFIYVPVLRWKQGEQGALRYTDAADREHMLPIAEVQQIETSATQPKLERPSSRPSACRRRANRLKPCSTSIWRVKAMARV